MFPYVLHQVAVSNLPYSPVTHELSSQPRARSAQQMVSKVTCETADLPVWQVEYWLEMFAIRPVEEWEEAMLELEDRPSLQNTFSGIFGYILLLR